MYMYNKSSTLSTPRYHKGEDKVGTRAAVRSGICEITPITTFALRLTPDLLTCDTNYCSSTS